MTAGLIAPHRVLWMTLDLAWSPASASVRHCCPTMALALRHDCAQYPTPFDCPDTALGDNEPFDEYGIPVRDGGCSYVFVRQCPWCGVALPASRRDDWFDPIERSGLADAPLKRIPKSFLTAAWRLPGPS